MANASECYRLGMIHAQVNFLQQQINNIASQTCPVVPSHKQESFVEQEAYWGASVSASDNDGSSPSHEPMVLEGLRNAPMRVRGNGYRPGTRTVN